MKTHHFIYSAAGLLIGLTVANILVQHVPAFAANSNLTNLNAILQRFNPVAIAGLIDVPGAPTAGDGNAK